MSALHAIVDRPVRVTVIALLVVLFGLIALRHIPVQLTPTVDRPVITIKTQWPGRSPQEVVDAITKEQEQQLKNVGGLDQMRSVTGEGQCEITLEFHLGIDIGRALQETADALRQVEAYPEEVTEPTLKAADSDASSAITWIILDVDPAYRDLDPDFDITTINDFVVDEIKPLLERVEGIAEINVFGGRQREVRVLVDNEALSQRGIGHVELVNALRAHNQNTSAGSIAEGKRDVRIRVLGQFTGVDSILSTVVAYRDGHPVFVRDVAEVEVGYQKRRGFVRSFGTPSLAVNAIRQTGANVMDVMAALRPRLDEVRKHILPHAHPVVGPRLRIRQVYDETTYIDSAIALVTDNLWLGGALAALVLAIFLRSVAATSVVALAIPMSIIATFVVLAAFGRSFNVISLAGLAFAVGMVVDNAIVVLENIDRHVSLGRSAREAAVIGTREVWGAVLASTLTTVCVFVPVLLMEQEAGQLFRDIAIALVGAVILSLVVAVGFIPCASAYWLRGGKKAAHTLPADRLLGRGLEACIGFLLVGVRRHVLRPLVVVVLTVASGVGAWWLMPPLDYLPAGNRNLVFGGLLIPPGYSVEKKMELARRIEAKLGPYAEVDDADPMAMARLAPIARRTHPSEPFAPVPIENFFIGGFGDSVFVGATSRQEEIVLPLGVLLTHAMGGLPDVFGGARQASIFGRGVGGSSGVDLEVSGPRLARVVSAAGFVFGQAGQLYGFGSVRPDPANFNLSQPEWQLRITEAGQELGLSSSSIGLSVRSFVDGAFVDEVDLDGRPTDMVLLPRGGRLENKEQLVHTPIATASGGAVPLAVVADIGSGSGPQVIRRLEELASVAIQIDQPPGVPLATVMEEIRTRVVEPARRSGLIDASMRVQLKGNAAKLDEVQQALFGQAAEAGAVAAGWQRALFACVGLIGLGVMVLWVRIGMRQAGAGWRDKVYAMAGVLCGAALLAGVLWGVASRPTLLEARFVWALVVTYLLMCILFESFVYPLVIMFSVPLAALGGFMGLAIVHAQTLADATKPVQQLDIMTMLGFVILIGIVVNNAILLVHQALHTMREADGLNRGDVDRIIAATVRTRVRPILMSTLTSVGGMLPLVLYPGAGSEMYRGLGSVVVGGLTVSTVFTLVLVPLVLSLVIDMREAWRGEQPTGMTL